MITAAKDSEARAANADPNVAADRRRVMAALTMVVDDCLQAWESVAGRDPEELVKAFATELVTLSRFVRKGETVEEFALARMRVAEECDEKGKAGG